MLLNGSQFSFIVFRSNAYLPSENDISSELKETKIELNCFCFSSVYTVYCNQRYENASQWRRGVVLGEFSSLEGYQFSHLSGFLLC